MLQSILSFFAPFYCYLLDLSNVKVQIFQLKFVMILLIFVSQHIYLNFDDN